MFALIFEVFNCSINGFNCWRLYNLNQWWAIRSVDQRPVPTSNHSAYSRWTPNRAIVYEFPFRFILSLFIIYCHKQRMQTIPRGSRFYSICQINFFSEIHAHFLGSKLPFNSHFTINITLTLKLTFKLKLMLTFMLTFMLTLMLTFMLTLFLTLILTFMLTSMFTS